MLRKKSMSPGNILPSGRTAKDIVNQNFIKCIAINRLLAILFIALLPAVSQAQLGDLIKKTKDKAVAKTNNRMEQKMGKAIDNALDKIEGKGQPSQTTGKEVGKNTGSNESNANETVTTNSSSLKAYAKYDFTPGEKIIYSNDFSEESLGELPVGWNSNGTGSVVSIEGQPGNWVQLYKDAFYLTDNKAFFSENFTVEFDLLLRRANPKGAFPQLGFGLTATHRDSTTHNQSIKDYRKYFAAELKIQPFDYNGSHMHYESFEKDNKYLETEIKKYPVLEKYFNTPLHISIQLQNERLRIWFNETKLYDLPKAIKPGIQLNQLFFFVKGNGSNEEEVSYNISNIRIAKGRADTRHRLVNEGKFSTTGILFDANAATMRPESNGVLKEVAEILKTDPAIKIKIIGHTDSNGGDVANMELSKKRAAAVKDKLAADFDIDPARMECDGKGESEPVADNQTRAGKAQNRRVEFIRIFFTTKI